MELHEALERIAAIHQQMARGQMFRGYRAATTALSGALAFLACGAQGLFLQESPLPCLGMWAGVAFLSVLIVALEMTLRCRRSGSALEREMTLGAAEHFIPTIVAGGLLTYVIAQFTDELWLLPGLWAILFGLGVFASRRMLPRPVIFVGAHYLLSGLLCVAILQGGKFFPAWTMAMTFGAGQLMAAAILWWCLERNHVPT